MSSCVAAGGEAGECCRVALLTFGQLRPCFPQGERRRTPRLHTLPLSSIGFSPQIYGSSSWKSLHKEEEKIYKAAFLCAFSFRPFDIYILELKSIILGKIKSINTRPHIRDMCVLNMTNNLSSLLMPGPSWCFQSPGAKPLCWRAANKQVQVDVWPVKGIRSHC